MPFRISLFIAVVSVLLASCNSGISGKDGNSTKDVTMSLRDAEISSNSKSARKYYESGRMKMKSQDYYGSVADYNEAIRLNTKLAGAYMSRGTAKFALGDYYNAISDFTEALNLDSYGTIYLSDIYSMRGRAKNRLGDKQGAIEDLQQAVILYKKECDAEKECDAVEYENLRKELVSLQN